MQVILDLTYWTINQRSLKGTQYESSKPAKAGAAPAASKEQEDLAALAVGVESLGQGLLSVVHEQQFLQHRHARHLHTVEKTHRRTMLATIGISCGLLTSAAGQVRTFFLWSAALAPQPGEALLLAGVTGAMRVEAQRGHNRAFYTRRSQ